MDQQNHLPEITLKAVILGILLALVLAASNTYLALKIGILTTASIPAAVLSMGILRLFRRSNILENNLVQTAASAGEAVAGGMVYTIPALIIIRYWSHFDYWTCFAIALIGGLLGVLFSIPLRKVLMTEKNLNFPEGKAIAEVLLIGAKKEVGLRQMLEGGAVGALIELMQSGLKIISNNFQFWFNTGKTVVGFGTGFSATLLGAGYLIGITVGVSLLIGAVIGWLVCVPLVGFHEGINVANPNASQIAGTIWSEKVRYIGIGAMLLAGFWTLLGLLKPFLVSMHTSIKAMHHTHIHTRFNAIPRTERDIPILYVMSGIAILLIILYFVFRDLFNLQALNIATQWHVPFLLVSIGYVLIFGFIFSAICTYFSGLVGVSASPGSAIMIGSLLFAAIILRTTLTFVDSFGLSQIQLFNAAAIIISIGAVVMGAAALADNIQVLKVGHIVGATPWKQQIMLMLGVLVAASIAPAVMELLFNVYGIGDVYPHLNMDHSQVLAAPPAAMMAAITQGIFNHKLPWNMVMIGAIIMILFIFIRSFLDKKNLSISILGIAIGIYLPLSSSIPLFIGSLFAFLTRKCLIQSKIQNHLTDKKENQNRQKGLLLACGLVSGAALMDVILAVPFALKGNPDALNIMPEKWNFIANVLGFMVIAIIGYWFYKVVCYTKSKRH